MAYSTTGKSVMLKKFDIFQIPYSASIVFIGNPGSGKCLDPYTHVIQVFVDDQGNTLEGSERLMLAKDVKRGDLILGDNGKPRVVMNTFKGKDTMYTIRQKYSPRLRERFPDLKIDGDYTVNSNHILTLAECIDFDPVSSATSSSTTYQVCEISAKQFFSLNEVEKERFSGICFTPDEGCVPKDYSSKLSDILSSNSNTSFFRDQEMNSAILQAHIDEVNVELEGWLNRVTPPSSPPTTPTSPLPPQIQLVDKLELYESIRNLITHARSMGREIDLSTDNDEIVLIPLKCIIDNKYEGNRFGSVCDFDMILEIEDDGDFCGFHLEDFDPDLINEGRFFEKVDDQSALEERIEGSHNRFVLGDYTVTHNTTGMINLLYYLSDRYPVGLAFMGSPGGYKDMCSIMHPLYVRKTLDIEALRKSIERQETMANELYGYMGNYSVLMIDDCTSDGSLKKGESSTLINKEFKNGSRHYHQLFMLGLHGLGDFSKSQARACSYIFLFAEHEAEEQYDLYRKIGGASGSVENFRTLLETAAPGPFKSLVIKKRNQSSVVDECFFYWETIPKSKMPGVTNGKWKFGCKEYREWAQKRYKRK